jgi:predicted permease
MTDWRAYARERLPKLGLRPEREAEIIEELAQQLEGAYSEACAAGVSEEAAHSAAAAQIPDWAKLAKEIRLAEEPVTGRLPEPVRESLHEQPAPGRRTANMLADLWQDVRYAARTLGKQPGFTAVVVLTLALGIGASTAIFTVVHGVLLRPLDLPRPEQIVIVNQVGQRGGLGNFSDPNFDDIKAQNSSMQALAEFTSITASVSGGIEPVRARGAFVSREFFAAVGVQPMLGRAFTAEDHKLGAAPVLLVSYGFWQRSLGATPDLSRYKLNVLDKPVAVVGVLPADFDFPTGVDLWAPRGLFSRYPSRTAHNFAVIGRIKDGVTLAQARADLSGIAKRLKQQYGDDTWMYDAAVTPLQETLVRGSREALLILLGAVAFLLLVACANVANLLLAQVSARQKELAVRAALGAGRVRLLRQFLTESLVLALAGGTLGLLAATWGVDALLALNPVQLPRAKEIHLSAPVLGFALGISLLTALIIGATTALRATRQNLQETLKESQRAIGGSGYRLRSALVVAQLGVTAVLLVGAGLLGKSFARLLSVDPGYRTSGAIVMDVDIPTGFGDDGVENARIARLHDEMLARLRAIPGVEQAGGVNRFPLAGGGANGVFLITSKPVADFKEFEALTKNPALTGQAEFRAATADYFRAMRIPLVRGRLFDEQDTPEGQHVAVISRSLAEQRWPTEDPLGQSIEFGNMDGDLRLMTIVGIVGDVREMGLDTKPQPTFYANARQRPGTTSSFTYVLAGSAPPAALTSAARNILHELAPDVPPRFRTIAQLLSASVAGRRFNLVLLASFGASAMVLAMMGIYGVTSFAVGQRTQEIGIRMALGAGRGDVLRMILGQSSRLVLAGVAGGLLGAMWLTRLLARLLYSVAPTDAPTFAACAVLLGLVALGACWIPARRATRVDPMVALRYE